MNWLKGIIVSNIIGLGFAILLKYIFEAEVEEQRGGVLVFSMFFIIPILMGFIAGIFWAFEKKKWGWFLLHSLFATLIACFGSIVVLGEGYLCLLIVLPVIYVLFVGGAAISMAIRSTRTNDSAQKLNVSVLGVLLVLMIGDVFSKHEFEQLISDEVIIDASPEKIWPNVVAFEPIKNKPQFWLFRVGMPYPYQTTVSASELGAGRKCIFSNGYTFDEVMTEFDINKKLTFDITNQPKDPEIMGHFSLSKGQFILQDLGNGKTKLIGNSWYKLYVFPAWYFDAWSAKIVREVHLRVMENIKVLSEKK